MNELLILNDTSEFPVDGRNLHEQLKVETPYRIWFPRMCEYGFTEGVDFNPNKNVRVGNEGDREVSREVTNHDLTIGMAKEVCMLQRSEQGKQVRRYLIDVENQWNQPESVMARALRMADQTIARLKGQTLHLQVANSELTVRNQIMAPKAEYFDDLVDRGVNISIRDSAKELGVKQNTFVDFLLKHKYLYRDKKGKLMPYAQYSGDLFVVKECFNEKTSWGGPQTLTTPKGRETFRLLLTGLVHQS